MNKPSAFWKSLEGLLHGGARLYGWKRVWGEQFHQFEPWLISVPGIASSVGCARTFAGHGCAYRIVDHENGPTVGVCDQGYCTRKVFKREELALFAIHLKPLVSQLSTLFGLMPGQGEISGPGKNLRLGTLKGIKSCSVIFTRQISSEAFARFLAEYFANAPGPTIFLLPTRRRLNDQSTHVLEAQKSACFYLDEALQYESGQFVFSPTGQAAWRHLLSRYASAGIGAQGFDLPAASSWHDLNLRFRDGHTLSVRVGRQSRQFTYQEMGMEDGRSKGPNRQWKLLYGFAEEHGILDWDSRHAHPRNQKQKEMLVNRLIVFFGLDGEPIHTIDNGRRWETVFNITLES